jgi:hypothetical protein
MPRDAIAALVYAVAPSAARCLIARLMPVRVRNRGARLPADRRRNMPAAEKC